MFAFLYLSITHIGFQKLAVHATKGQSRVQRVSSQEQENEVQLPDLNHSPPPEVEVLTPSNHIPEVEQGKKTSYAKTLEKYANKGLLNEFRESENIRVKAYRKTLKPEIRLAQSRRNTKLMTEKYKAVSELQEQIICRIK